MEILGQVGSWLVGGKEQWFNICQIVMYRQPVSSTITRVSFFNPYMKLERWCLIFISQIRAMRLTQVMQLTQVTQLLHRRPRLYIAVGLSSNQWHTLNSMVKITLHQQDSRLPTSLQTEQPGFYVFNVLGFWVWLLWRMGSIAEMFLDHWPAPSKVTSSLPSPPWQAQSRRLHPVIPSSPNHEA